MINHTLLKSSRYSTPSIAPELLSRLRTIQAHKGYPPRQANTFSTIHPHPDFASRRWYSPYSALPHPHIIGAVENGAKASLYVLMPKDRTILHLKMRSKVWWIEDADEESEVGAILPAHASYSEGRLLSPASSHQMHALSKLLLIPRYHLPRLTKYNANLMIQEILITPHLDEIMAFVGLEMTRRKKNLKRPA